MEATPRTQGPTKPVANKTVRKRIKWQMRQAREKAEEIMVSLSAMDDLAGGNSPYIDKHLPVIVLGLSTVMDAMAAFNEGL